MSISRETLEQLVAEDEFGLLKVTPKAAPVSQDDRLLASFFEIVEFTKSAGYAPRDPDEHDYVDPIESSLFWRLSGIRGSSEKSEKLRDYDEFGLLAGTEAPTSVADILALPDVDNLIDETAREITTLRNVPEQIEQPESYAEQRPCEDFDKFAPLFEKCHAQLKSGERKLIKFRGEGSVKAGDFYVLRGALVYVAEMGEDVRDRRGKVYARTRCIYDNGTESDLLARSLGRALLRGGKRVTEPEAETWERMGLDPETPMGTVYLLRSLSEDSQVRNIPDLHKIGFTRGEAEDRVKHAEASETFMNAPVEVVATYKMPAAMAPKVEGMLHRFFADARLDVTFERNGVGVAQADEWFSVPLPVIDEAIELIANETIVNYEFDLGSRAIQLAGS